MCIPMCMTDGERETPEPVRETRESAPVGVSGALGPPGPMSISKTLSRPTHHSKYLHRRGILPGYLGFSTDT